LQVSGSKGNQPDVLAQNGGPVRLLCKIHFVSVD
jgi:hypothetical protein